MSGVRFEGLLYRALNPLYALTPLSGEGAARYGGRFNRVGRPAIYAALHPHTAIREANQIGTLQPTTLVALKADIRPVFNARDAAALAKYHMTADALGDPDWRRRMIRRQAVPTQDLSEALIGDGFAAMIVPSFAAGAPDDASNMVLWRWKPPAKASLTLVDDQNRLGPG
ncbi:MAG: RES family NAD+ phosphorylase [Pacificimonas sp.]